jgi:hypothetical protein
MKQRTKQIDLHCVRLLAGACGLFTILAIAQAGMAQQAAPNSVNTNAGAVHFAAAPAAAVVKPAEEEEAAPAAKPGGEGVKVHGHWVIQVKNADGTLGERREFSNSLVTDQAELSGDEVLAALLSGNATPGDPTIALIQPPLPANPIAYCDTQGLDLMPPTATNCFGLTTTQSGLPLTGYNFESGLSTTVYFSPTVKWVLTGNYSVPANLNTISVVQTLMTLCTSKGQAFTGGSANPFTGSVSGRSADNGSKACVPNGGSTGGSTSDWVYYATLTSTAIPGGPVSVTAGQIIALTVTISFS